MACSVQIDAIWRRLQASGPQVAHAQVKHRNVFCGHIKLLDEPLTDSIFVARRHGWSFACPSGASMASGHSNAAIQSANYGTAGGIVGCPAQARSKDGSFEWPLLSTDRSAARIP